MSNSYHWEALRKQRIIERKNQAIQRLEGRGIKGDGTAMSKYMMQKVPDESPIITDAGQFEQQRVPVEVLPLFRVSEDGFKNRYRSRHLLAPHCDPAYTILYPGSDNVEYTCSENQNNRRRNKTADKLEILKKINGDFHVYVLNETPE